MIEALHAQAMPLIRAGGLFLIIVGAAIMAGTLRYRSRGLILGFGAAAGALTLIFFAAPLSAPYGPPSALQLWSLAIAIAFEAVAIAVVAPRAARHGERAATAATLAIVGAHFLIMTPAFGPLIVALGAATIANASVGARMPAYPTPALWAVDGALKTGFGAAMLLAR